MLLTSALKGMEKYKEALHDYRGASTPSAISESAHLLAQYLSTAEDIIAGMQEKLDLDEAVSFEKHIVQGKSANAAKELTKREFVKERATIAKINRLVSSGWSLVNESQTRIKVLLAEASSQI